jgi:hypothetical protein
MSLSSGQGVSLETELITLGMSSMTR